MTGERDRGRRGRRRPGRAHDRPRLTTIWWRDIPTQVVAHPVDGGPPVRAELPRTFLAAVDRAAMEAGLAGTDDYLAAWDRRTRPCGDDLDAEVADEVDRLVNAHPRQVLAALVANGARRPQALPNGADPVPHGDHSDPSDSSTTGPP